MEALFASLVAKYGFDVAAKMLGLDQQTDNPKYTFGMPFTGKEISFDPVKTLGRFGLNKVMSGGIGGMAVPAAFLGGAVMLGRAFDPIRPGSRNYNPNLAGQIDYLNFNNMIGRDQNSGGLKYGPGSVLAGQNVISMFGTNDYQKQLDKKVDYFEDRIKKGKKYSKKNYEKAKKEQAAIQDYNVQKTIEQNQFKNLQNINAGGDGGGSAQTSGYSNVDGGPVSNRTGRGRQGYGKGGIASL